MLVVGYGQRGEQEELLLGPCPAGQLRGLIRDRTNFFAIRFQLRSVREAADGLNGCGCGCPHCTGRFATCTALKTRKSPEKIPHRTSKDLEALGVAVLSASRVLAMALEDLVEGAKRHIDQSPNDMELYRSSSNRLFRGKVYLEVLKVRVRLNRPCKLSLR